MVSASATDNVGVVGVQCKLDSVNLGAEVTIYSGPSNLNTTCPRLNEKNHSFRCLR